MYIYATYGLVGIYSLNIYNVVLFESGPTSRQYILGFCSVYTHNIHITRVSFVKRARFHSSGHFSRHFHGRHDLRTYLLSIGSPKHNRRRILVRDTLRRFRFEKQKEKVERK